MNNEYRICKRCVIDTSDPVIRFNSDGICNHCSEFINVRAEHSYKGKETDDKFKALIQEIKSGSEGRQYDCVVGLSGGIDSSYVAYLAKKMAFAYWLFTWTTGGIRKRQYKIYEILPKF